MPKEIVLGEHVPPIIGEHEDLGDQVEGVVQVGWQDWPVSHVQVATFSRVAVTHETVWDGFYVTLDRQGINELIRHLRKARDKAFLKDE